MDDEKISDFLIYEMPPVNTEVTVLLGSGCVSGSVARAGAVRYNSGLCEKFIISGGISTFAPHLYLGLVMLGFGSQCKPSDFLSVKRESDIMADILVKSGVPHSAIVFKDDKATNTGQNFANIHSELRLFNTAAIITPAHHQRRALATALKSFAGTTPPAFVTYGVYPFGVGRENWPQSPLAKYVRSEAHKVDPARQGQKGNYVGTFCVPLSNEEIQINLRAISLHNQRKSGLGPS